jgi:2-keto-4-pentenoate hydratase
MKYLIGALAVAASTANAACLTDAQAKAFVDDYMSRTPAADVLGQSETDAACTRTRIDAMLRERKGEPIGYKVGLTNDAIRRMLKGSNPVWGAFYRGDFVASDSSVSVRFGARPTVEADLLVRVGDATINSASTPEEVLAAIDAVIPFIELPDMMVANPLTLDANGLAAINAAARGGAMGTPIALPPDVAQRKSLADALGTMKVRIADGSGKPLGESTGSELLGHPLRAALWLVQALAKAGIVLKPGDVLSLGSFPPVMVPRAGSTVSVTYDGLPGSPSVRVKFTE